MLGPDRKKWGQKDFHLINIQKELAEKMMQDYGPGSRLNGRPLYPGEEVEIKLERKYSQVIDTDGELREELRQKIIKEGWADVKFAGNKYCVEVTLINKS